MPKGLQGFQKGNKIGIGNKHALGRKRSEEFKENLRNRQAGSKSHFWKDGRCNDKKYLSWIKNKRNRTKRGADGGHTLGEWENMKAQYNWTCPCCKRKEPEIKLTEDHIIPISRGGTDNIENIQPLCKSCNSKKHTVSIKYEK